MNIFSDENFNDDETIFDELINSLISSNLENEKRKLNIKNRNIRNQNKQFDSQNCLQNEIVYEIIMDCSEKSDYIIYYRK